MRAATEQGGGKRGRDGSRDGTFCGGFPGGGENVVWHATFWVGWARGEENGIEYGDFEKFLNFTFMGGVARGNAEGPRQLAMGPGPAKGAKLSGAVTADAKVSWSAEDDSERAGFEILWRETPDSRWTVCDFVAAAGETVLNGVSTDKHFFAVRAVGKNGARAIAVPTEMEGRPPPPPTPGQQ